MTKRELIAQLRGCPAPGDAEVLFCVPDEEEIESRTTLAVDALQLEEAHDEDCTRFIRVYLVCPAFEASLNEEAAPAIGPVS